MHSYPHHPRRFSLEGVGLVLRGPAQGSEPGGVLEYRGLGDAHQGWTVRFLDDSRWAGHTWVQDPDEAVRNLEGNYVWLPRHRDGELALTLNTRLGPWELCLRPTFASDSVATKFGDNLTLTWTPDGIQLPSPYTQGEIGALEMAVTSIVNR